MATKLEKAQVEVKRLWNLMLEWDGISPDAMFVVFSDSNPFSKDYNNAVTKYMRLRNRKAAKLALQYSPSQWAVRS